MEFLISGSLAYDRIMNYNGRFAEKIIPDKIHMLNVSFNVNGLKERLGGTAGNIAYGLALMGEKPMVLGSVGRDGRQYLDHLESLGIITRHIRFIEEEYTAGCFITTDQDNNQITGFNPGAMNHPCNFDPSGVDKENTLAIVAPCEIEDMTVLPELYRKHGVRFIFDPGQALNIFDGEKLIAAMRGAWMLISSDYELEWIMRMSGLDMDGLLKLVEVVVTTKGSHGSEIHYRDGKVHQIPCAPEDINKDPTGAGDAYRAGMMAALAKGSDLVEACRWGSCLGAFSIEHQGTQEYRVTMEQFKKRLAMMPGN